MWALVTNKVRVKEKVWGQQDLRKRGRYEKGAINWAVLLYWSLASGDEKAIREDGLLDWSECLDAQRETRDATRGMRDAGHATRGVNLILLF